MIYVTAEKTMTEDSWHYVSLRPEPEYIMSLSEYLASLFDSSRHNYTTASLN